MQGGLVGLGVFLCLREGIYSKFDEENSKVAKIFISNTRKLNAMQLSMYSEIPEVVSQLMADSLDLRAVVIQGEGEKAFGSGSDISEFQQKGQGQPKWKITP